MGHCAPDLDADLLAIPAFLVRVAGDTGPVRRPRRKAWRTTPAAKKQAVRDAKKRERDAARPVVFAAVKDGAETFQAIRKATGLGSSITHSALRHFVNKRRAIRKDGRRYFVVGR